MFGVCFCSSLAAFYARQCESRVVILHKRALTQQKELPNAALRVRLVALWALSLVAHIESLCYAPRFAPKTPPTRTRLRAKTTAPRRLLSERGGAHCRRSTAASSATAMSEWGPSPTWLPASAARSQNTPAEVGYDAPRGASRETSTSSTSTPQRRRYSQVDHRSGRTKTTFVAERFPHLLI